MCVTQKTVRYTNELRKSSSFYLSPPFRPFVFRLSSTKKILSGGFVSTSVSEFRIEVEKSYSVQKIGKTYNFLSPFLDFEISKDAY